MRCSLASRATNAYYDAVLVDHVTHFTACWACVLTQATQTGPHTSISDVISSRWWRHLRLRLPDIRSNGEGSRRSQVPAAISHHPTGMSVRCRYKLLINSQVLPPTRQKIGHFGDVFLAFAIINVTFLLANLLASTEIQASVIFLLHLLYIWHTTLFFYQLKAA